MSLFRKGAILVYSVVLASCSPGGSNGSPRLQVTPETLLGRWIALPKELADETPGVMEVKGPARETAKFRWEFKKDRTYEMSVEAKVANIPALARQGKVSGIWKVVETRGNTLTIELPIEDFSTRVKVVFESKDKCIYDAGEGEVMVLNRIQ